MDRSYSDKTVHPRAGLPGLAARFAAAFGLFQALWMIAIIGMNDDPPPLRSLLAPSLFVIDALMHLDAGGLVPRP
ncbi:hypothetical protein [Labrys neptuniae]